MLILVCYTRQLFAQPDPVFGYLLPGTESKWFIGGDLTDIYAVQKVSPPGNNNITGGVTLYGDYADYYRTGSLESFDASFGRNWKIDGYLKGGSKYRWQANTSYGELRWRINTFESFSDQSFNIEENDQLSSVSGAVTRDEYTVRSRITLRNNAYLEPEIGISVPVLNYGTLNIGYKQNQPVLFSDLAWHDNHAELEILSKRETYQGSLIIDQLGKFDSGVHVKQTTWERQEDRGSIPTIEPWGDDFLAHGYLGYRWEEWKFALGYRMFNLDMQAYGIKEPYPYAKFTALEFETDSWFISAKRTSEDLSGYNIFEFERLIWSGYSRGHVEFWPFTSGLVDLLGLRRYFIAETSGSVYRFHAGIEHQLSDQFRFIGGLNILDIYPDLKIKHWRPYYLVFGKDDEQFHKLDVSRVIPGIISLSVTWKPASYRVQYSFIQAFPIKTWREKEAPKEPQTETTDKEENPVYGGGFHQLSLSLYFNLK